MRSYCFGIKMWIPSIVALLGYFRVYQQKFVYSDASDHACGSFIQNEGNVFHQNWSSAERSKSSTWRELKTVELALISFAPSLRARYADCMVY